MSASALAVIFALVALAFPFFSYVIKPKIKSEEVESIAEIKASLTFLHTAWPTLLLILAAIGFGTYDEVVNKVTDKVIAKLNVDSLVTKIKEFHNQADIATKSIQSMEKEGRDTILNIADTSFLRMLPKGTIIPYSGNKDSITLLSAIFK
ncbi:hypothetical protein L0244_35250 [bacterium]|nr:hypothetical protein [bacterium]